MILNEFHNTLCMPANLGLLFMKLILKSFEIMKEYKIKKRKGSNAHAREMKIPQK